MDFYDPRDVSRREFDDVFSAHDEAERRAEKQARQTTAAKNLKLGFAYVSCGNTNKKNYAVRVRAKGTPLLDGKPHP